MVAHTYNPTTQKAEIGRSTVWGWLEQKVTETLQLNKNKLGAKVHIAPR
jgi:hypothetical protein